MRTRWLVIIVGLVGCHSLRQDAETAYNHHDYLKAAQLFDRLVQQSPNDAQLVARRNDARTRVLHYLLANVRFARELGKPALAIERLDDLLEQRDLWAMVTAEADAGTLAVEVATASNDIEAEVIGTTSRVGPLAGEAALHHHHALLARRDFGTREATIAARVTTVGRERCTALAADAAPDLPSWSWLVARYCGHFGSDVVIDRGVLADHRQGLAIDGPIGGLSDAEATGFRSQIATAFATSAWFAPNGDGVLHATIAGRIDAAFSSQPLSLSASWTEQVPYTDYVTESESYQEPYDDTESYTEEVPYTDTEWKTVPCGDSTCPTTETVTKYRTEWKTRTVTKYRTAWRDVQKAVTRYREVPHVFNYQATQYDGHYTSKLAVQLDRTHATLVDLTAAIDRDEQQTGIEHDVTFAEANVYPSHANLMSRAELIAAERERLQARLIAVLDARYTAKFCTLAVYTRDDAAACAYLDLEAAPAAVHTTLRGTFGGDEAFLPGILAR